MKVKIIDVGSRDAWIRNRKELIGAVGNFDQWGKLRGGWKSGRFTPESPIPCVFNYVDFYAVKIEEIKVEPISDETLLQTDGSFPAIITDVGKTDEWYKAKRLLIGMPIAVTYYYFPTELDEFHAIQATLPNKQSYAFHAVKYERVEK